MDPARQAERFSGEPESLLHSAEGAGALRRAEHLPLGQSHRAENAAEQQRSRNEHEVNQRDRQGDRRGHEAQAHRGRAAGDPPSRRQSLCYHRRRGGWDTEAFERGGERTGGHGSTPDASVGPVHGSTITIL
jgi:hypothetical protein